MAFIQAQTHWQAMAQAQAQAQARNMAMMTPQLTMGMMGTSPYMPMAQAQQAAMAQEAQHMAMMTQTLQVTPVQHLAMGTGIEPGEEKPPAPETHE
jgi:hypothetical protein